MPLFWTLLCEHASFLTMGDGVQILWNGGDAIGAKGGLAAIKAGGRASVAEKGLASTFHCMGAAG